MFSVPHGFKPDLLWILLAHFLKKQFIKFINPALLLVLRRENHSAELQTLCYLFTYRWIRKVFTVVVCSKLSVPSFSEIIWIFLRCWISSSFCDFSKERPTDTWQVMSDTVRNYRSLLSDIYGHITSTVWILLRQNLLALSTSATVHLTGKIMLIRSILNCHRFNGNCERK
jgi:hypothetical protein